MTQPFKDHVLYCKWLLVGKHILKPLEPHSRTMCQRRKIMVMDFSRSKSQRIKKYRISDEMDEREDKEGDAVCTEHTSMSSEV
jgi:hypothetical protein